MQNVIPCPLNIPVIDVWRQCIISTKAVLIPIGSLGTNFDDFWHIDMDTSLQNATKLSRPLCVNADFSIAHIKWPIDV